MSEREQRKRIRKESKEHLRALTRGRRARARGFSRVVKYGVKSFGRNFWLSMAAVVVMTITLTIIAATLIVRSVMETVVDEVRDQVDMSVYIKQATAREDVDEIVGEMRGLASVREVRVTTPDEANAEAIEKFINERGITDPELIQAAWDAPNPLPWILNVKIVDIDDTAELEDFVYNAGVMEGRLDAKPPSFSGNRKENIAKIAEGINAVGWGGLIAGGVFVVIAGLIIFNTIRMAIFNRKEEIYMMKLIGAGKSFMRGPFIVEAMLYGLVAAVVAGGIVGGVMAVLSESIGEVMEPTVRVMMEWWWAGALGLVIVGMVIGWISAWLATKRYLRRM